MNDYNLSEITQESIRLPGIPHKRGTSDCDTICRVDYSKITEELFIGTTPNIQDYNHLRDLGVQLVINMRVERRPWPDLHHTPMSFLWLPTFDSPFVPIPIRFLQRGAAAALETIKEGGKVYVHCAGGRHRGVAMGAAILIAQGMDPQAAMQLIKERRSFADPGIFYVRSRILRFAREWNAGQQGQQSIKSA